MGIEMRYVRNRLKSLAQNPVLNSNNTFTKGAQSIIESGRVSDINRFIESASNTKEEVPFFTILELYDALIEKGSDSDIEKMGRFIVEEVIVKTRDTKQLQALLKRRLTRLKNKNKLGNPSSNKTAKKQKIAQEAYENMIKHVEIYSNCDRILENYNRISKRFNLELLIAENTKMNGVYDTVITLCDRIDTYSMPDNVKFNTVIETALYGFHSHSIEFEKSEILEAAIDYFAFKENGLTACREILENTLFFDKDDYKGDIDIFMEDEPEEENKEDADSTIRNHYSNKAPDTVVKEASEFNELFAKFKEEELGKDGKPENKLRSLITKLYSNNVDNIVESTPNLLKWIRGFFIVGSAAIPFVGPIIMVIGYIADKFISLHMEQKEVKKMIKCFQNEIKASKKKLNTTTDNAEKERLNKYIKSLEDAEEKINMYYMDISSDDDMLDDNFSDNDIDTSSSSEDNDDFFGIDDDEFDFDDEFLEVFSIVSIDRDIQTIMEYTEEYNITESDMYSIVDKLDDENIVTTASIVSKFPEVFYKESFMSGVENAIRDIRKNKVTFESSITRSLRLNSLTCSLAILKEHKEFIPSNILEAEMQISAISEAYKGLTMILNSEESSNILEASFINTLKMASMKLRRALTKLSDKEKKISKSIDVSMNNLTKSLERGLSNNNRESIIKGSIIPSASKVLKIAILNAGLVILHQPVIAVIGTLGYIGVSLLSRAKDRQMIIDEIDIELKMCKKYIDIAEQKNDMKALKQLLMIQRDLERQSQRIKYKMKVDLGKKYYDTKHVSDDN